MFLNVIFPFLFRQFFLDALIFENKDTYLFDYKRITYENKKATAWICCYFWVDIYLFCYFFS